jgi:hypothetical protein
VGVTEETTIVVSADPAEVSAAVCERRNHLLAQGDEAAQVRDYDRAIERYLLTTFYDSLGRYRPVFDNTCRKTGFAFDPRLAVIAPSVLHRIAKCANAGDVELFVIQLRFIDLAITESEAIAHLRPLLSPEQAWAMIEERLRKWLATDARVRARSNRALRASDDQPSTNLKRPAES